MLHCTQKRVEFAPAVGPITFHGIFATKFTKRFEKCKMHIPAIIVDEVTAISYLERFSAGTEKGIKFLVTEKDVRELEVSNKLLTTGSLEHNLFGREPNR